MLKNLTDEQIDARLTVLERMTAQANPKDLPSLNDTIQKLINEQARRDLAREEGRP